MRVFRSVGEAANPSVARAGNRQCPAGNTLSLGMSLWPDMAVSSLRIGPNSRPNGVGTGRRFGQDGIGKGPVSPPTRIGSVQDLAPTKQGPG